MAISPTLHCMIRAVEKAAPGIRRDYGELDKLQISKKGAQDFVTKTDVRAEKILQEELSYARPKFGFMMEESGEIEGEDKNHRWVIDPLDGTSNFIHAIPYFCISVALERRQDDGSFAPIIGVVYDPLHDDMFTAELGEGAFHNRYKIRVSKRTEDLFFSTGSPRRGKTNNHEIVTRINKLTETGAVVRCSGAAALDLAYVACGRYDAIWYDSLRTWDMSAGMLIVQEAGGRVSDLTGESCVDAKDGVLASNNLVHDRLVSCLKESA